MTWLRASNSAGRCTVLLIAALVTMSLESAVATARSTQPASTAAGAAGPALVRHGVKPLVTHPTRLAAGSGTLSIGSSARMGVVSPKPRVYLVFWGSQWSNDPAGAATDLHQLFLGLFGSADQWGAIMDQYCEGVPVGTVTCGSLGTHVAHPTRSPLAGTWFDNAASAPSRATGDQLGAEAVRAAVHFGNLTQTPNLNAQYVIASASGTHPDGFPSGFCGWHSDIGSTHGKLAFTNLPYVPDLGAGACTTLRHPRLLDGYESTETHEYAEVLTDFWPSDGWNGAQGEIADACVALDTQEKLSSGTFDVQGLWSNARNACRTRA